MPQYKVMFARFPYGGEEAYQSSDWMIETVWKAKTDPRISDVYGRVYNDTPVTSTRNRAVKHAKELGCDYLVMIDSDMAPDIAYPGAKPFWDTAWEFVLQHRHKPCLIAAPYAGPPPKELPYIFHWRNGQSENPNCDFELVLMSREEAAIRGGIEEVAALPTGLMLIDMRVHDYISPPYFEYEWADEPFRTEKGSTEDVYYTRNVSLAGCPVYVAWDCWAGHLKTKLVGKPEFLKASDIRECFLGALKRGHNGSEQLIHVGTGKNGTVRPRSQVVSGLRNREAEHDGVLSQV